MPTLPVDGVTLAYDDCGQGEPILFIHGIFVSRTQWGPQIDYFARRNYRVIACDLRGHGQSSASTDRYSVSLFANDVIALLDALKVEQVTCCGHSFGGLVAQELALSFPDRIRGLILAETLYGLASTPWEVAWTTLLNGLLSQMMSVEDQVKIFGTYFGMLTPGAIAYIQQECMRHIQDPDNHRNIMRASLDFNSRWRLHHIACPTLVLVGQYLHLLLAHIHGYEMVWRIPRAKLSVIPQAGHILHWDNPDAFNQAITEFVASNQGLPARV